MLQLNIKFSLRNRVPIKVNFLYIIVPIQVNFRYILVPIKVNFRYMVLKFEFTHTHTRTRRYSQNSCLFPSYLHLLNIIVYYSVGFTDSASKFWRQNYKNMDVPLLIRRKILMLFSLNIFLYIMFLIDAIKLNVEKKFKTCFIFLRYCLGEKSR